MNEMLDDLILGWDVTNEDGSPFPKTRRTSASCSPSRQGPHLR